MAKSSNYPVNHTFDTTGYDTISYNINLGVGGLTIYNGYLVPYDNTSNSLTIDISEICREYLECFYEDIILNNNISSLTSHNRISSIATFEVELDSVTTPYTVVYDYNTDYISDLPDVRLLNDPIDNRVDPRLKLFISGYNLSGSLAYTASVGATIIANGTLNSNLILMLPINLSNTSTNDTVITTMTGVGTLNYKVVELCPLRYCVYYVNKYGGLDSLLCLGRDIESWNPDRTDVRLYDNRLNRLDWQLKRICQEIDHLFELNTGLLTDELALKIDHLIYSPKVWLHDLTKNTITSCLITNTGYSVKKYRYDRVVLYTFNVVESLKQRRM